jgi:hypothetical protein
MKIIIRDKIKRHQFNAIFNIIKVNSTCVNLKFNSNELHIQGMDKSHICLFNILIKKDWFNEYNCSSDEASACFDTTTFYNIINSVSKNQSILISDLEHEYNLNEKLNDFIYVTLINEDYKEKDNLVKLGDEEYKWTDVWDALYYRFIDKNQNMLKKIYAAARNVAQWNKKSNDEQKKLLNLANKYLNHL